jgi:hypothetical protein
MGGETNREAEIRRLKQEIARCKWAMGNITDTKTLERLEDYLGDLQRALGVRESSRPPGDGGGD